MGRRAIALSAGVAAAVAAWWLLPESLHPRAIGGSRSGVGSDRSTAAGGPQILPVELAGAAPFPADPGVVDAARAELPAAAIPAQDLPPPGQVAFTVVDAGGGAKLPSVQVRFLHELRFAEHSGDGEVEIRLTPGRWEARVAAGGREPVDLEPFTIESGRTTSLGPVALAEGSAVVEGIVRARHLPDEAPVLVQLSGEGRSPCEECRPRPDVEPAAGCPCGFQDARNELSLQGDRRFRFGRLAAGVYWLRAFDESQRIADLERVEVGRGGAAWRELEVSAPTVARIELRHDRGGLFTGDWSTVHREQPAPIRFSFRRRDKETGAADWTPSPDDVRSTMGAPPLPLGGSEEPPASAALHGWTGFPSRGIAGRSSAATALVSLNFNFVITREDGTIVFRSGPQPADRSDRPREDGDRIDFDAAEPDAGVAALSIAALRPDLFEVSPLPRLEFMVQVTCGNYASAETPLDLRHGSAAPLVVTLLPTEPWLAQLAEIAEGAPASCNACHAAVGAPQAALWNLDEFDGSLSIAGSGTMEGDGNLGVWLHRVLQVEAVRAAAAGEPEQPVDR